MSLLKTAAAAALVLGASAVHAQSVPTSGATVIVPAYGQVTAPNDQAVATFAIEEQDKDKAAAASRVNQKMKQGLEIVRKADPQASLKTQGYYTYPVYAEADAQPVPQNRPRVPVSWRVGQYLQVTTTNLDGLPKTVAAAQSILSLNGLHFGLSPETTRQLEDQRIAAAYQNLNERVRAIAHAMGRQMSEAVLDTVDFEGSGNYLDKVTVTGQRAVAAYASAPAPKVEEPSFEPGESTLQMRLVGKVRFK